MFFSANNFVISSFHLNIKQAKVNLVECTGHQNFIIRPTGICTPKTKVPQKPQAWFIVIK